MALSQLPPKPPLVVPSEPIAQPDNRLPTANWYSWFFRVSNVVEAIQGTKDILQQLVINGVSPDDDGEMTLTPDDLGAEPAWGVDTWTGNGTLELADMRKAWAVEGDATITIEGGTGIPAGYAADFYQVDDGVTVQFAEGSGATLLSFDTKRTLAGQNAGATVRHMGGDVFRLEGRLV